MNKQRYVLIGGIPIYPGYGPMSFAGLSIYDYASTEEEMTRKSKEHYNDCGGIYIWIDRETGLATNQ